MVRHPFSICNPTEISIFETAMWRRLTTAIDNKTIVRSGFALMGIMLTMVGCMTGFGRNSFPDASALPAQTNLPDPLIMWDGRPVTSREQWNKERRPELKALFAHYMYGPIP